MKNIEIGGRLHSIATGNIVTGANEVYDDNKEKKQSVINTEIDETFEDINDALADRYTMAETNAQINAKQFELGAVVIDDIPREGSENLVRSGSVYDAYAHQVYLREESEVFAPVGFDSLADTIHKGAQVLSDIEKNQVRANLGFGNGNIDDVPISGSDNLVKSGGVASKIFLSGPKNTSNVYDIKPLFGFYRGDLSAGIPNPTTENTSKRIYSGLLYSGNNNSITISISTGCRYVVFYYTDSTGSTIKSKSGTEIWRTDTWTVDDDTYFRIYVANATTIESETNITDAYTSINYASILIESKRITIFEEEVNDRFGNDERDIRNLYDITGVISPSLSNGTGNFAVNSRITDKYKDDSRVITSVIQRKSGKKYMIKCSGNFDAYIYNIANSNKIITYNPGWISSNNTELVISEGDYFRLCFKKSNVTSLNPDDITVIIRELDIDYWKSELDTKIAAINTNSGTYTNGVSFAFITDTHIEENIGKSPELLERIFALTEVDIILHGGDFIVDGNTKSDNIELLNKALKIYENVNSSLMIPTIGNHDLGMVNPMSVPQCERILTNKVRINELCYSVGNWFTEPSFIANIDTQTKTTVISLGRKVPTSGYFRTEDINYLVRAIDSLDDGANVILLTHIIWSSGNIAEANTIVLNILDALKNKQAYQNTTYGVNVNYTTAKYDNMDVVCVLCGHEHTDGNIITSGGIPVIRTRSDAYNSTNKGTVQEQAFDIIQIDYDNSMIYCTRIGNGSNRSFIF